MNNYGLPDTQDGHSFVNEVFNRAPRKASRKHGADNARKQAEKEAKELRKQKYTLLQDDDPQSSGITPLKHDKDKDRSHKSREKKDRHIRKRETDGLDWEDDVEELPPKRWKGDDEPPPEVEQEEEEPELPEDENVRRERERMQDLKERDAFAERVKERDRDRTKKVIEDKSTKGVSAEVLQRRVLAGDPVARVAAMPSLRERSRQEYLSKRELQQIELLRREIADDESLFRGMKVSKRELQDLEYKKEVLRLAEERMKIDDSFDGYQLPEDYLTEQGKIDKKRKEAVLYQRYEDAKTKEDQFVTDVDQWEASQTRHSTFKAGAADRETVADSYEYVFDEAQTIKFVMESTMGGNGMLSAKDKLLNAQIEEAEKRGE